MAVLIQIRDAHKSYGDQVLLDGAEATLIDDVKVGFVGRNGAGKSTLIKILSGVYPPSAGEIRFKGQKVDFRSPLDARQSGIEMIYQDLALAEDLDIAANIFLGREMRKRYGPIRLLDRDGMAMAAARDLDELGLEDRVLRIEAVGVREPARPRAVGQTDAAENRRVEIILTEQLVDEMNADADYTNPDLARGG